MNLLKIQYYQRSRHLMGSAFEITVYDEKETCQEAVDLAFREIGRIERLLSIFKADSEMAKINRMAKKGIISLDPTALDILSLSIHYAQLTGGAFDPTAGPLIQLFRNRAPTTEEIAFVLQSVGYQHLKIDKIAHSLALLQDGMALDLGAIGKGYAIDRTVAVLKKNGVTSARVSCKSTIYGLGKPPFRAGWPVAIQHPRQSDQKIGFLLLCNQAISTSGDYERSCNYQGQAVCHVIDPRTGWPTEGVASATVISDTATAADALSTALLVQGERGLNALNLIDNSEGYLILEDKGKPLQTLESSGWGPERGSSSFTLSRRNFLAACASFIIGLFLPRLAFSVIVYATKEEALARMMPEADRFETQEVHLSPDQLIKAQEMAGKGFREQDYTFWLGKKGEEVIGYATMLDVIGKERPITFLIGINPDGTIQGMEVLIYRESEGSQIRYERFMQQFRNKRQTDLLQMGNDIQSITGATLSSRAAAYAAKKALALFTVLYNYE